MPKNDDEKSKPAKPEAKVEETARDVLLQANEDSQKVIKQQGEHIEKLTADLQRVAKENEDLRNDAKYKDTRIDALEKKLKASKAAPTGDVVFLGGKTWPIKGTVEAKWALDQVKKGFIFEDATLVILGDKPNDE